jgi:hypothetical protein
MSPCALDFGTRDHITYSHNGILAAGVVEKIASDGLVVLENGRTILSDCVTCVSRRMARDGGLS